MEFRYKINGAYTTRYFVKKKEKKGREIREIFQRIARSKNVGRRRSLFTREANIVDRRLGWKLIERPPPSLLDRANAKIAHFAIIGSRFDYLSAI